MIQHLWGLEPISLPSSRAKRDAEGKLVRITEGAMVGLIECARINPIDGLRRLLAHKFFAEQLSTLLITVNSDCQIVVAVPRRTDDQTADREAVRALATAVWFGDPETGL